MLAVAFLGLAYGLYQRWLVQATSGGSALNSLWDIILGVATNPQFLAFVLIPAWLLFMIMSTHRAIQLPRLIRLGSNRSVLLATCWSAAKVYFGTAGLLLIAWAIASAGLPLASSPSPNSAASVFESSHVVPLLALLLQGLLLAFTFITLQAVFIAIRLAVETPVSLILIAATVWLWTVLSASGAIDSDSVANAAYYFDAAAIIRNPATGVTGLVVVLMFAVLSWLTVFCIDRNVQGWAIQIVTPRTVFVGTGMILLWLFFAVAGMSRLPLFDAITSALYGNSGFIVQNLVSMYLFLGFAYVFQLHLSDLYNGLLGLQLIRRKSFRNWSVWLLASELLRAAGYVAILGVGASLIYVAVGGRDFSFPSDGIGLWLYQFGVNGFLQLAFYTIWCFGALSTIRSQVSGLVALGILLIVSLVYASPAGWSPVGAAGMDRIQLGWNAVLTSSGTLVIASALSLLLTSIVLTIRKPQI